MNKRKLTKEKKSYRNKKKLKKQNNTYRRQKIVTIQKGEKKDENIEDLM